MMMIICREIGHRTSLCASDVCLLQESDDGRLVLLRLLGTRISDPCTRTCFAPHSVSN